MNHSAETTTVAPGKHTASDRTLAEVLAWTLAPPVILVALAAIGGKIGGKSGGWIVAVMLVLAIVAQGYAFRKSRRLSRQSPWVIRAANGLLAFVSACLLMVWAMMALLVFYYWMNPGAGMLFGGS